MIMEKAKERGEVVLYQPDDTIRLEVRLEQETVWLTQDQISVLFGKDRSVITKHINKIFDQGELDQESNVHFLHIPNSDKPVKFYNLDVILSVGYRVHSTQGILFRRWSSTVLKQHLLRGYSINQQLMQMEDRIDRRLEAQHDEIQHIKEIQQKQQSQIDFFVRTSLPPVEGVFFDGQVWDAYELLSQLIKSAQKRIVLIDNYIDDSVLTLLDKRTPGVSAMIYTMQISKQLSLDIAKHDAQYTPIPVKVLKKAHDRFLIIDDDVYHVGASIKDLGKKWTAIMKMESIDLSSLLSHL